VRIPFRIPARDTQRFDVVGFGLNSVDLVAVVAEFPHPNTKQRLQRFARLPGGQTATALSVCARLGLLAAYIGTFGSDELGALSRESLTSVGVDISSARTVAGATNQFAMILVDARSGERTVLWDRDPALATDPSSLPRETVTAGRMLLVDCHETAAAAQAARWARDAGIPTVADIEKVRPGIVDLLQNVDAIIMAQEFPGALTGHEEIGRALETIARDFGAPLVCVTLGAEGSLAWCQGREIRTPAFPIDCVDTTGAGDAFRGAFAAACLRHPLDDIETVLSYANAVAALNCRALGARGGLPTADEVEAMVARPQM
jgi:sugar/nucleoside kinase (ribokinase family)